jgi:hypothetical protein
MGGAACLPGSSGMEWPEGGLGLIPPFKPVPAVGIPLHLVLHGCALTRG